jgi:hypothetical protein
MTGKRGISEIAAAMLLITIAVAASIIIYIYSSGLLGSLQGARPQQPYANQITLEYYDWSSSSSNGNCYSPDLHKLCLTLRNVGAGIAVLADFFVAGVKVTLDTGAGSTCAGYTGGRTTIAITGTATQTYTATGLLPQGPNSCTAILDIPTTGSTATISPGVAYSVRVVTVDGSTFSFSCIAGQSTGSLS